MAAGNLGCKEIVQESSTPCIGNTIVLVQGSTTWQCIYTNGEIKLVS